MSTYLGNPSLSTAVKDRVTTTFDQSLALFRQGRIEEVIAGCGLILRMDPQFDPARKLLDKAQNPFSSVDVDSLIPSTSSAGEAMILAREAMATRDFQRVVNITTEILTNDLMNDDARILGDDAREKMEAAPFVEQFVRKCEQHVSTGNLAAARADLEKARSLDPDHPALRRMEEIIRSGPATSTTAPTTSAHSPSASPSPGFNFDAGPSFVVDPPATPSGRGTAQASDFGFTFEEEKPATPAPAPSAPFGGGFSFDSPSTPSSFDFKAPAPPAAPIKPPVAADGGFSFGAPQDPFAGGFSFDGAPPSAPVSQPFDFGASAPVSAGARVPGSGDFDFANASLDTSPDDERKIDQYLTDGDRAYDASDFQKAIDLWSRIFLIDVTNEHASERIERAKVKRREVEQRVDGMLATAINAFERDDAVTARQKFDEILRLDPGNHVAQDYLSQLGDAAPMVAPSFDLSQPASDEGMWDDRPSDSGFDSLRPPDPSAPPVEAVTRVAKKPSPPAKVTPTAVVATTDRSRRSMGAILAVAGVLLVAGLGWLGWSKFMRPPATEESSGTGVISRATALSSHGKYDEAISMLREVRPDSPQHDKALELIADLQKKKALATEMIDGRPAATVYDEGLAMGKSAFDSHDYDGSKKAFESAERVKPLPPDMKALYDQAVQQSSKLDAARTLFNERKYSEAIVALQPLTLQDPTNKNITQMVEAAHFDLGAVALQDEKTAEAMQHFDEVLKIDPNDELAKKSRDLASRYNEQPKDLLYKIFIKYLPARKVG